MNPSLACISPISLIVILLILHAGCSGGGTPTVPNDRNVQADEPVGMRNMSDSDIKGEDSFTFDIIE